MAYDGDRNWLACITLAAISDAEIYSPLGQLQHMEQFGKRNLTPTVFSLISSPMELKVGTFIHVV